MTQLLIKAEAQSQTSLLSSIYDAVNASQPRNVSKFTGDFSGDAEIIKPTSGMRLRIYAIRFTCGDNADLVTFLRSNTPFEQYGNVKAGGMYGQNMIQFHYDLDVDETLSIGISKNFD